MIRIRMISHLQPRIPPPMDSSTTIYLQSLLDRLNEGDASARDEMINQACERLTILTRKMFRDFPRLRQWEQTEDVSQNAAMRLRRAMESVSPTSVREFFGLAAVQIRRELLDMTRSIYGRQRRSDNDEPAANRGRPLFKQAGFSKSDETDVAAPDPGDSTHDPTRLAAWGDFHQLVEQMPEKLREVVDLLFYQELTQQEAADVLSVDSSTVKRRWREARLQLADALQGWLPR